MARYTVTKAMVHDGHGYAEGDTVEMDAADAARYGGLLKPVKRSSGKGSSRSPATDDD